VEIELMRLCGRLDMFSVTHEQRRYTGHINSDTGNVNPQYKTNTSAKLSFTHLSLVLGQSCCRRRSTSICDNTWRSWTNLKELIVLAPISVLY